MYIYIHVYINHIYLHTATHPFCRIIGQGVTRCHPHMLPLIASLQSDDADAPAKLYIYTYIHTCIYKSYTPTYSHAPLLQD